MDARVDAVPFMKLKRFLIDAGVPKSEAGNTPSKPGLVQLAEKHGVDLQAIFAEYGGDPEPAAAPTPQPATPQPSAGSAPRQSPRAKPLAKPLATGGDATLAEPDVGASGASSASRTPADEPSGADEPVGEDDTAPPSEPEDEPMVEEAIELCVDDEWKR